jgi:predicted transcriptional regulator of viral defense system
LTFWGDVGDIIPYNTMIRKLSTSDFFATHAVFSLGEAVRALDPPGGRAGTVERLKYHLARGRLKRVARETYAVVPPGVAVEQYQPDPFMVAATMRPECLFSHHSALELLGAAHSVWNQCTVFAQQRRQPLALNGTTVRFLDHPKAMRALGDLHFATRKTERRGVLLRVTGPERTLVEGFRRPGLVGGLEELVVSAAGFATLDLEQLEEVLRRYGMRKLWGAAGWFLERFQRTFHVPEQYLRRVEGQCPSSPQYLIRDSRGGALVPRWNLILPREAIRVMEPDEP